jgi:hypothetical protein
MTKFRTLLVGVAIALAFASPAIYSWAQQLTSVTLTGNEVAVFAIGGPGGPSLFVPVAELRNATGYQSTAAVSGTITIVNTSTRLVTTAQVTGAMTVNAPATPWDGEMFELVNASGANNTATVTFTAAAGQTVNGGAVATQANQTSAEWMYVLATTTWIRVR